MATHIIRFPGADIHTTKIKSTSGDIDSDGDISLLSSGITNVTIKSGGNVGIGTLTPQSKLHVNGGSYISSNLTVGSNLTVDTNTLHVDSVSNRVGIGKTNPGFDLDVAGDLNFTGSFYQNGSAFVSTPWTISGDNLAYTSGNVTIDTTTFHVDSVSNRVGIGKTNPGFSLDINGDINFSGSLYEGGSPFAGSPWTTSGTSIYYNTGNVGIGVAAPTSKLHVSGSIYATGDVTAYSDMRTKKDIQPIKNALEKVCSIGGYTFIKEDEDRRTAGVLAQEMLSIFPEVVYGSEETNYAVAYGNIVGLLIESIKELKSEVNTLKKYIHQSA